MHELEQALGDSEDRKPGVLQSMGHKESDTTWPLNKNKLWAAGLSYKPGPESKVRFGVMHSLKMPSH